MGAKRFSGMQSRQRLHRTLFRSIYFELCPVLRWAVLKTFYQGSGSPLEIFKLKLTYTFKNCF